MAAALTVSSLSPSLATYGLCWGRWHLPVGTMVSGQEGHWQQGPQWVRSCTAELVLLLPRGPRDPVRVLQGGLALC